MCNALFAFTASCTARLTAEGCQSAGGNAETEGRSFSASAPPLSALLPAHLHTSAVSIIVHHACPTTWKCDVI